jgi:acetyl-CoA C-acetyltransferase
VEREVAIVGAGQTPFLRRCDISISEMCFGAFCNAMEGLNLKTEDIDASVVCSATEYDKQ